MSLNRDEFQKSLGRLDALAKGGATQLHHTGADSNPGTWAGSAQQDQSEYDNGIDDNGTDYGGVKKALAAKVAKSQALTPAEVAIVKGLDPRPLIADKIVKGQKLTQAESWAVKGGFDKMKAELDKSTAKPTDSTTGIGESNSASNVPDTNAGGKDTEIEGNAKKSLGGAIDSSQSLRKGIEMSPILAEFARAVGTALDGMEARVAKSIADAIGGVNTKVETVAKSFASFTAESGEFQKGFAEAIVGIGQTLTGQAEVAASQAHTPAGAPRSQMRAPAQGNAQVIHKSFGGPGGLDVSGDAMNKSNIVNAMVDLVKANKLSQLDVVKFETSSQMSPSVQQLVSAHLGGTQ